MAATKSIVADPAVPSYWAEACKHLVKKDRVMKRLIPQFADATLQTRGDAFGTLARSIVGQQISVKAAQTVWERFAALPRAMTPAAVLKLKIDDMRAAGLSARKVEYLSDLARHFGNGQIHTHRWPAMSDAEIIKELTAVRGIGVWTAEMFLIFNQLRPDIFPLDDIGLQKAVAKHYCAGERPGRSQLIGIGERWRPWRSVATWYLWRSLDPVPVEY